jgi:hypothetical protein
MEEMWDFTLQCAIVTSSCDDGDSAFLDKAAPIDRSYPTHFVVMVDEHCALVNQLQDQHKITMFPKTFSRCHRATAASVNVS